MLSDYATAPANVQPLPPWTKPTIAQIPLNSVGHAACALALDGFHVFPLKVADRTPAHRGWQDEASNDVARVAELFPVGSVWAIGLAPWKSGHVVADLDEKHGHRGIAAFEQLERQHGAELTALPPTVLTKSGGQHRYYRFALADTPPRCSIGKLGDGIDIKCRGGFVVAAGSPGYCLAPGSAPLSEAPPLPDWLDALCRQGSEGEPRRAVPGVVLDDPARITRAVEIARSLPAAVEFEGSDAATIAAANALMDWTDEDHAAAILIEHWMPRCIGEWDEEYVELKVQNAAASRENDIGCAEFADPAATFGQEKIMKAKVVGRLKLKPGTTVEQVREIIERVTGRGPLPGLPPGMSADDFNGPQITIDQLIEELNREDNVTIAPVEIMPGRRLRLVRGTDMQPEKITWLWPDWLAVGKLHLIAGRKGDAKSTITLDLAARLSTGVAWPDGSPGALGDTLIFSSEDGWKDTILPRFLAAGGDGNRFFQIEGSDDGKGGARQMFDPSRDIPLLEDAIRQLPNCKLLILDPFALVIRSEQSNNAGNRRDMHPVVDFAERHGIAILGITHFSKDSEKKHVTDRFTGSLAQGAQARVLMATATDPDGNMRRMVRVNSNIGPSGGGIEYRVVEVPVPGHPDIRSTRVQWGAQLRGAPAELLAEVTGRQSELATTQQFIEAQIIQNQGYIAVRDLEAAANAHGIAPATLKRARKTLKDAGRLMLVKNGPGWFLSLTAEGAAEAGKPIHVGP